MAKPEPERSRPGPLYRVVALLVVLGGLLRALRSPRRSSAGQPGVGREALALGYEPSDLRPRVVAGGAMVFLLSLAVILVAVSALQVKLTGVPASVSRPQDLISGLTPAPTPPEPRLEAQPGEQLGPYLASQQQKLNSYRWVDRQQGVVAIPIERAMDRLAQQGLPAATPAPGSDAAGQRSPSSASSGRFEEPWP